MSATPVSPRKRLSLRAGFAWSFAGNMIVVVCQALLTKVTSDEMMGRFFVAQGLCIPAFMFASLDLRMLQATDGRNELRFFDCLTLRLLTGSLALLLVPLFGLLRGDDRETLLVIGGVALAKFIELQSDACHALMQKAERLDRVTLSQVTHGILASLMLGGATWLTGSLVAGVFLSAAIHLSLLVAIDLPVAIRLKRMCDQEAGLAPSGLLTRDEWRELRFARLWPVARQGLPLASRALLTSLNAQAPRLCVERLSGLAAAGVFGPISMAVTAATTVSRALNHAVATRMGQYAARPDRRRFRSLMAQMQLLYLALGVVAIGLSMAFGRPVLAIVFRPDFAEHQPVLVLVAAAVAVQYHNGVLDLGLVALRRTELLVPTSCLSLGMTVGLCAVLIPSFGLPGAAAAMVASRVTRSLILMPVLLRHSRDDAQAEEIRSAAVPDGISCADGAESQRAAA